MSVPDLIVAEPDASPGPQSVASPRPALAPALERLLLANQIRELADMRSPVTTAELPRLDGLIARAVRRVYGGGRVVARYVPDAWDVLRRVALDLGLLLWLRVWLAKGRIWRMARTTVGAMLRAMVWYRARYHALPSFAVTGYAADGRETGVIRVSLLLRTMKRYGACIELLLRRWRSGLLVEQTRQWLAFFLREVGEAEAAQALEPAGAADRAPRLDAAARHPVPARSRLRYGIVVPVMDDSAVFRSSLLSLVESDFDGAVVVVEEGYRTERVCEAFCRQLPVTYIKNPDWTGPSGVLNLALQHLAPQTEIACFAHSDVLWPPRWFEQLDRAWDRVYDLRKVGLINLGYLQLHATTEAALTELFQRGRYDDLLWLLRMRRDIEPALEHVQDLQTISQGRLFGIGWDNQVHRPAQLRLMTGRFSVACFFPVSLWQAIGGFNPAMPFGIDPQLLYHACLNRMWSLWIDNAPLIHLVSGDSSRLAGESKRIWIGMYQRTFEEFARIYGMPLDHFFWTCFGELGLLYHDEIVEAANDLRFDKIEFFFNELFARLKRKTLASCELLSCPSRPACPYT